MTNPLYHSTYHECIRSLQQSTDYISTGTGWMMKHCHRTAVKVAG